MRPYDRKDFCVERVRSDARWRELERTRPMQSGWEYMAGIALVIAAICGLLYTLAAFL